MKVTIENPNIITLLCRQEKSDPDYGSCMWARFYLDTKNYTMSIESDCGNYSHGWFPTPDSESFLELLSRMDQHYLLGKISSRSVIDEDETWKLVKEVVEDAAQFDSVDLDSDMWEEIERACCNGNTRDVVDEVLSALESTDLYGKVDPYSLYECVQKDYPVSAKKIVAVFCSCIQPKIKEINERETKAGVSNAYQ